MALASNVWNATHQPDSSSSSYDYSTIYNQVSSTDRIPIIYGSRKWGGYTTWYDVSDDKKTLIKDILLCEGEIEGIYDVRADDIKIGDNLVNPYTGQGKAVIKLMMAWAFNNEYAGGCSYTTNLGSSSQSPPSNYTVTGGYKNCAWMRTTLVPSDKLSSSNPVVTCIVKGKKIYDTRTLTTAYSENPAMIVRDYLLSKRYGAGNFISSDVLDEDSFKEVADYCDELVTTRVPTTLSTADAINTKITALQTYLSISSLSASATEDINNEIISLQKALITINSTPVEYTLEVTPRYTLNMIITQMASHKDILMDMFSCFGGMLIFSNNKVSLRCEKATNVSYDFTDDTIVKDSLSYTPYTLDETPNRYNVTFYDPTNNFAGVKVVCEDTVDQKERQKIIPKDVDLYGCISQPQALRLARLYRDKNKLCFIVTQFSTATMAMHLEAGDVITVTKYIYPDGVATLLFDKLPFRILEISEQNGIYTIKGEQYNASIYNDSLGAQIQVKNYVPIANPFSDTVPDCSNITTSQTYYKQGDGTIISDLILNYNLPAYQFTKQIEINYSIDNGISWYNAGYTNDNKFTIHNALIGKTYVVKLVTQNTVQRKSNGTISDTILITGKDANPSDITSFVVAQQGNYFIVSGINSTDVDFSTMEIRMDGSSWYNSEFVAKVNIFPSYIPSVGILDGTHVFRCKAIDNGGNYSTNDIEFILNVTDINTYKNIILSRNDISLSGGTLTNLVKLPNGQLISPYVIQYGDYATYSDLPISTYPSPVNHIEYLSPPIDTFKAGKTNVNFIFSYDFYDENSTYGSISNRTYGKYPLDTYGHITNISTVVVQIRFSNDNSTWTNWQPYISAEYNFRYIQYWLTADYESKTARAIIKSLQQYYDVLDATYSQTLAVPNTGIDILFNGLFYQTPTEVTHTVINGSGNVYPDITNLSTSGLHMDCYDRTGTKVTGTVLLVCKGY